MVNLEVIHIKSCQSHLSDTLGQTNLGHNKFGYHNFGYHNFSHKFCKLLVYNNFSHIFRLFQTIFQSIYLIFPCIQRIFLMCKRSSNPSRAIGLWYSFVIRIVSQRQFLHTKQFSSRNGDAIILILNNVRLIIFMSYMLY